ncbi:OmpA family protein [Fulvivirga imtechensis]|nr:OmpA family protein [Fulvivirga imtechensis]
MHIRILFCLSFVVGFLNFSYSQKVLWASEVLEVSSERRAPVHLMQIMGHAHKANEVLGEPNIMPGSDGSTRAWTPKKTDQIDFIKVGFEEAIAIKQIAIAETINPTAVWKVFAYDESGREYLINTFNPHPIPLKGRLINLFMEETHYKVKAVKVMLNGAQVPGYNGIDAIAISDSDIPITIDIKIADGIYESVAPQKLTNNINSPYKDLKPLLTPDGKTMFFSRVKDPNNIGGEQDLEDIWYSERDDNGEWSKAQNIGMPLNNEGPNFICSVTPSAEGYVLLLGNRYKKGKMIEGLSIAHKSDSGLTGTRPVIIENHENFSAYANYFLGNNEKILLMSVQRRDTYGNRDLYVSFVQDNGRWSTPKNLGNVINTSEEESSPFLAPDGKTLYFSTKGHLGFGGSDVFVSRRIDDSWTKWTEPENLGPFINSPDDEIFFHLAYDTKYAYYTKGNGLDADIYRLELPLFHLPEPVVELNVTVLDKNTLEPIPHANLVIFDKNKNKEEWKQKSDGSGKFSFVIPNGTKYEISAQAENYLSIESHMVDLSVVYESDEIDYVIHMDPIEVGQRIPLDNIYFDFNKATLRTESIPQLDKIYSFLEENSKVKIQLDGHTCSMGSEDYNQKLSEERARSVMDYLLNKGIRSKQVNSAGFGESKPLASNETESGRVQNRRVEFVITDK